MNPIAQRRIDYIKEQVDKGLLPERKPIEYKPRKKKSKIERAEIKARYYQKNKARFHEWYLMNRKKKQANETN